MHKSKGFSLIELVTTIAILGVVGALAVPAFKGFRINSQISSMSGDMVSTVNQARSLAISTRTSVYVIQGAGDAAGSVDIGSDWGEGWRISRGATLATSTQISQVRRTGGFADVSVLVSNGDVDLDGNASGAAITGFAFNNFGQLMTTDGLALSQAAIVICAPEYESERGRTIAISRIGRITNNSVDNPSACDE